MVKKKKDYTLWFVVLMILGIISFATGNFASVIYAIYSWAQGMELAAALWEGAKLWLWMVPGGFVAIFVGLVGAQE